ncbi:hypothetical protein Gohar_023101 [Gossypium harknessii]|uniref:Protein TRM32-like n=1 Tax=Gossypium harknessii TaxID=34285 RepID=A0A7J9HBT7_9ROSI|nr:hypothetical protein [Gossypium harknessii]
MGRKFDEQSVEVEFENHHPGCMGGLFNVLDYHHWYYAKKILPQRKLNRGRQARCCANPQTISMEREPVESQRLLDGEAEQIQVQQQTRKTGSTNKRSSEAPTKGLTSKERAKEENHDKQWIVGHSTGSQLQQADSTHHLEPSSFGLGWMNPIILVRKRGETSGTSSAKSKNPDADKHFEHIQNSEKHDKIGARTLVNQKPKSKKLSEQVSYNQVEGVDVLEIFKVNNDLFLDILQDPDVGISQHFPGKQTPKAVKLTKSGSFPIPGSPRAGYLRSSTLEHKKKEVWSFQKGEKPVAGTQLSKSRAIMRTGDQSQNNVKEEASSSSSQGSDSQRWNHLVMNRLKDIKQRIKQALKERKKTNNRTKVDGLTLQVSSRDTLSTSERDMSKSSEKAVIGSCIENNAADHDVSNDRLKRITRTKSINESLDRYTQLFQQSVSKETKLHHSRSLKLSHEDRIPSIGNAPKFFRRISSLSELESFCSLLYEVSSELPINNIQDHEADKKTDPHNEQKSISSPEDIDRFELVEAVIETELQEEMREGSDNRDSTGLSVDKNGEEIAKSCEFNEDAVEQTGGLGEAEFFTKERRKIRQESVDYKTMGNSRRILFFEQDTEADPCYNYVKDILELSGFSQNKGLQTWFSLDQPLDPSVFNELERLGSTFYEVGSNCDHQLVFDLVNEALLEINGMSPEYFPNPFSFNSRISLVPKGNNVVQQVWTKVSKNLASQPQHDQSLDDIIARDLDKPAWMNLQADSEFVALELEDLVFHELLDEVVCFLDN